MTELCPTNKNTVIMDVMILHNCFNHNVKASSATIPVTETVGITMLLSFELISGFLTF